MDNNSLIGRIRPQLPRQTREVNIWLHPMLNTFHPPNRQNMCFTSIVNINVYGVGTRDGLLGRFEETSRPINATTKEKAKAEDSSWEMPVMPKKRGMFTSKEKEKNATITLLGKDSADEATPKTSLATL